MGSPQKISSVHVSGATMSFLLAAAYAAEPATKYLFTLYGHYDRRTVVTDREERVEVFDVVVVAAAPVSTKFRGKADPVGLLSISKSPVHKLSFQDTAFLAANSPISVAKPGRESDPKIFVLMTQDANENRAAGTLKVEFTTYQVGYGQGGSHRLLDLKIDNLVDSLPAFTAIVDSCNRNPSVIHLAKPEKPVPEVRNIRLDTAIQRIESDSKEKAELVRRIVELHKAIGAKKSLTAASDK